VQLSVPDSKAHWGYIAKVTRVLVTVEPSCNMGQDSQAATVEWHAATARTDPNVPASEQ
jgi:hypothetical protein